MSNLRLYLDSADIPTWQRLLPTGMFYGVTTNPKLLYQEGILCTVENLAKLADAAFELEAQEIHLQVWGKDTESMLAIGREIADIDCRVSIKVPITTVGIVCARQLIDEGNRVTLTAVHAASQLLTAIALGADYAAPYLGRMNDAGLNGLDELRIMQQMVRRLESHTRILAASIRQLSDLTALAEYGLDTFTLLPDLVDELLENPLTIKAAAEFNEKAQLKE
ncbi:MAG: transaldolase [Ardenticatenaceae bacterium]|nr:transaldolase [Ardenticatenaceae bacterium]MCB9445850.1 transaldolase [Ardenticatenaceae bacterium]